jgi:putative oxidoreductase
MKQFRDIIIWLDKNNNTAYSLIRIFFGAALFVRGLIFILNPNAIIELAGTEKLYWWYSYLTIAHLIGGAMLMVGFYTRLSALIQIPILAGAVFFVHLKEGLLAHGQSLELSALVLLLLIIYFLFGSGALSIDNYILNRKPGDIPTNKNL